MPRASIMRRGAVALLAGVAVPLSAGALAAAQSQVTITVDTTSDVVDIGGAQTVADLPGPDGRTSLREAAIATTNTDGPETVAFDIPTTDPGFTGQEFVIGIDPDPLPDRLSYALQLGDDATTIDATTQPGGVPVVVEGGPQSTTESGGLRITASGNTVIGLGVRGYASGIQVDGVDGSVSNNRLVGVTATRNANGITMFGATGTVLTDSTVSDSLRPGIVVSSNAVDTVIDGNTITGNGNDGVFILLSDDTTVTDNVIGDNGQSGINFEAESGITGTPDPDDPTPGGVASGNTITGNGSRGIAVAAGDRFTISRNTITDNARLGIDLGSGKPDQFGVSRNDSASDTDRGGNQVLNFPERLIAADSGTATTVEGRVAARDPRSLTIELFASGAPDPSGHGEGETFLATATADARGRFTATLPSGLAGQWLTATSTDVDGNTSEFSQAVQVARRR